MGIQSWPGGEIEKLQKCWEQSFVKHEEVTFYHSSTNSLESLEYAKNSSKDDYKP